MYKFKSIGLILIVLLFSVSVCHSYRKVGRTNKTKKEYQSILVYTPIKYNMVFKGNIGLIGLPKDSFLNNYLSDKKIHYGFGFAGEYHTEGRFAFGINFDRVSNKILSVNIYSGSLIYKFWTKKVNIPIATIQYGFANPDISNSHTAKMVKFGFGFIGHTSGKTNLRGLFFIQRFFSSKELDRYSIDYIQTYGLDIMLGIPL